MNLEKSHQWIIRLDGAEFPCDKPLWEFVFHTLKKECIATLNNSMLDWIYDHLKSEETKTILRKVNPDEEISTRKNKELFSAIIDEFIYIEYGKRCEDKWFGRILYIYASGFNDAFYNDLAEKIEAQHPTEIDYVWIDTDCDGTVKGIRIQNEWEQLLNEYHTEKVLNLPLFKLAVQRAWQIFSKTVDEIYIDKELIEWLMYIKKFSELNDYPKAGCTKDEFAACKNIADGLYKTAVHECYCGDEHIGIDHKKCFCVCNFFCEDGFNPDNFDDDFKMVVEYIKEEQLCY